MELPKDFDGVFRFTNFTDSEFKGKWNNVEYSFPAKSTVPMFIAGATPEDVQHIRKKFAKELAVREFYKSEKAQKLNTLNPVNQTTLAGSVSYVDEDLKESIQRCLEPMPEAKATAKVLPKQDIEGALKKDRRGRPVTRILDEGESLLQKGSQDME